MQNINKLIPALIVGLCLVFTACEDEVLVPVEDNTAVADLLGKINTLDNQLIEYSLEKRTVTLANRKLEKALDSLEAFYSDFRVNGNKITEVQYTVNVISTANYAQGRTTGLTGATVTLHQGDFTETKETNSGLVVFKGLQEGEAVVTVSAPEHTRIEMIVHFMGDGTYSMNADYYNAATQVLLYPVSGSNVATIKGNMHANTSTVNDTLNRLYGYSSVFGEKANTFVAKPGLFPYSENYTQQEVWHNRMLATPFTHNDYYWHSPSGQGVQFEKVPGTFTLFAIAQPHLTLQPNNPYFTGENAGYIKSITYKDLIFEATITDNESYEVKVPASAATNLSVQLFASEIIANHTRFTVSQANAGPGTTQETGAEKISYRYYNSTDYTRNFQGSVQDDGSISHPTVDPNQAVNLSLWVKTEPHKYEMRGNHVLGAHLHPGQVKFNNIYFWPVSRQ